MGVNNEIKNCSIAIVGAGNMAREHARAFADVPGVKLAGIYSRTYERAKTLAEEFGISAVCRSVAELYERTEADLVVVTVSETSMNAVSRECFEFSWTSLLEKPPGYNLRDAEEIHAAALSRKRRVLVAFNRRFYSSTQMTLADLNKADESRFIHVQDQQSMADAAAYGFPLEVVQNLMYANSIHLIDYFRVFGRGEVSSVTPVVNFDAATPGVVVSKISFSSGDIGLYTGIWDGPAPWAVTVNTASRRWELRPLEQLAIQNRGVRRLQPTEISSWDQAFKPGFRLQAQHAVLSALDRPSASVPLSDALETMRLIRNIFEGEHAQSG